MDELRKVLERAGFDYADLSPLFRSGRSPVMRFTTPGGDAAVKAWHRLRELVPTIGHWPVILGEVEEASEMAADVDTMATMSVADTLAAATEIDGAAWFAARRAELAEEFAEYNPGEDPADFETPEGEWPEELGPNHAFMVPFDVLSRRPHERVLMALVPTTVPWEVPAHLALGGWNECPVAEAQCAVHRYWNTRCGAEIVCASRDVVEMYVPRPPQTRDGALTLAREQYTYCADIVEQGTETIANLASLLLGGTAWYFWWD